jgi:hypothetical protein
MFGLEVAIRLPLRFDEARLRRDLDAVLRNRGRLIPHYGEYHDGGWSAIGLISQGGDPENLRLGDQAYSETPALAVAPYFKEVINAIKCEKQRVRLMALEPRANIFEHYDKEESLDAGVARLHVPVVTNDQVDFFLAKRRQRWKAGELWYGDFSFPHHLCNRGRETRVHLVLDCVVSDQLLSLFPAGYADKTRLRAAYRSLMLTEFDWRRRFREQA